MQMTPGTRLGPYEIITPVGSGGMGEVYRARDTRLDRDVAIKILAEPLAGRPDFRTRLEREARAVSRLNHPNICALYDIGQHEERAFLVMEYLEGETLARRLDRGPLPVAEALGICARIAAALEAAHAHGVLHRDLKTTNVQVTPGGTVKLLDFGLAKSEPGSEAEASRAITAPPEKTREGSLIGTPSYMSPEQARGWPVDRRTDIWSLGCILYEALAGRRAFPGETVADILAAVLNREPDWEALRPGTPLAIRRLLQRCLEKDPERRLRDAGDARIEIEEATHLGSRAGARRRQTRAAWAGLTALTALVGGLLIWRLSARPPALSLPPLTQLTFARGIEESPAWSPAGDRIAYSEASGGVRRIFVQHVAGGTPEALTRGSFDDIQPDWSPDGRRLAFVRARVPGRRLEPLDIFGQYVGGDVWALDLESGEERRIVEEAFDPDWSPDGRRIAVDASWVGARRIWVLDEEGRNPRQVTFDPSEAVSHLCPRWSPDGGRIAFENLERTRFNLRVVDIGTGLQVPITDDAFRNLNPAWAPAGGFLYFSSNRTGGVNIWRIPLRPDGQPSGRPQQITTGPGHDVGPAVSPDGGRIVFSTLNQNADLYVLPVDPGTGSPAGPAREAVATTREDSRGAWSPDGTRIAFNSDRGGDMNIWIQEPADGGTHQVTHGPGGDFQPNWSPDGTRIAFFSSRAGTPDIWTVDVESGELKNLTERSSMEINPFFDPDGGRIAFQSDAGGRIEVWIMKTDGSELRPLTRIGAMGHSMRWTADGTHVVFRSPAGGAPGSFRVPAAGGDPEALPEVAGGSHMSFSPDRLRILDVVDHRALWISPLNGGAPTRVFQFDDPDVRIDYPVWSPDGERMLFDRFRPEGGDLWLMTDMDRLG